MNNYTSLKKLRGAAQPRPLMALDTEDDQLGFGQRSGFYFGVIVTGGDDPDKYQTHTFRQRWRLIRYLTQPRFGGHWCACHNLEYDMLNVFGPKMIALMSPCFSGSKLCSLRIPCRGSDKFVTMWDTTSFMPQALRKLAPLVGMAKLDMVHSPGKRTLTAKEIEYAVADTVITWKLAHFIQRGANDLGARMRLTAASTSMDLFRRQYQTASIPCLPEETQKELLKGYYGGRVECFRLGEFQGDLYGNDFNGMYVSVMIDGNLPEIESLKRKRTPDLSREGMAHVTVNIPEHLWAGPLPNRDNKTGKLTFPVGKLTGWWAYNELRSALNSGVTITKVHDAYHSERCLPYLRDMMIKLRGIRENPETPAPVGQLAKLLGNSLYGKWCQRVEDFDYMTLAQYSLMLRSGDPRMHEYDLSSAKIYLQFSLVRLEKPMGFARHSNVIWGACITGGARNKLFAHLDESTSYYCDTDSVLGEQGYPKTKKLGALALKDEYSHLVIRGNKLYAGFSREQKDWEAHAKGIPRTQALGAVLLPDEPITSKRPIKFRSALAGRGPANKWVEITKRQCLTYDKRHVNADGSTRPLIMAG